MQIAWLPLESPQFPITALIWTSAKGPALSLSFAVNPKLVWVKSQIE